MFKFILVFASLFLNKSINYQEVTEVTSKEILDEKGGYVLYQEDEENYLYHQHSNWEAVLPEANSYYSLIKEGNFLYLYLEEDGVFIEEYDINGRVIASKQIFNNPVKIEDIIYQDKLYLFGSINTYQEEFLEAKRENKEGEDAIILSFNSEYELIDFDIYGGSLDESFLKAVSFEEGFFVVGRKDPETGGDFGNGGRFKNSLFVSKLNKNLILQSTIVLSTSSKVLDLSYYKDFLYLANENSLYKISLDLEIIEKQIFLESYQDAVLASYNKYLFFGSGKIEIVNIINFNSKTFVSKYLDSALFIKVQRETIIIKTKNETLKYDLVNLEEFIIPKIYYPEVQTPKSVFGVFGEAELQEEVSSPVFNPSIHGNYQKEFFYKTDKGISFSIIRNQKVEIISNVSNNNIYPLGFRLNFTGRAELNGVTIINNYQLTEAGNYNLILYDSENEMTEINFLVSNIQISFSENPQTNWDLEVVTGEDFFLEMEILEIGNRELKGIIIDGVEKRNLIFNTTNNLLTIPLKASNNVGVKSYFLEKLLYFEDGLLLSLPIYKLVRVNILAPTLNITLDQKSSLDYEIYLEDKYQTARYLEVVISNEVEEYQEIYPLGTQKLLFSNLNSDCYQAKIYIVYDNGNRQKNKFMVFEGKLKGKEDLVIGEMNILKKGKSLENFKLSLGASFTELKSQQKILYESNNNNIIKNILVGVVAGGLGFSGVFFGNRMKKKRLFKKSLDK